MRENVVWVLGFLLSVSACRTNARALDQDSSLLADPSAVTGPEFSDVYNVIELADGRIVFADGRKKIVLAGSLDSGVFDTIGHVGTGPGQYQTPAFVYAASDTVFLLVDIGLWRVTKWSIDGTFLGDWTIPASRVFGIDSLSRLYASELVPRSGSDSIHLFRWSLGAPAVDTIARVKGVESYRVERQRGYQLIGVAYGYRPAFGVLLNGAVWVARDKPYRVDWRSSDGRWTVGAARAYEPIRVTARERRATRDVWGDPRADLGPESRFADVKAPFLEGVTDPSGTAWVRRYTSTDDSLPLYELFDSGGTYVRSVRLPFGYRVMGFGEKNRVYALRKDVRGLMQVARFQMAERGPVENP